MAVFSLEPGGDKKVNEHAYNVVFTVAHQSEHQGLFAPLATIFGNFGNGLGALQLIASVEEDPTVHVAVRLRIRPCSFPPVCYESN